MCGCWIEQSAEDFLAPSVKRNVGQNISFLSTSAMTMPDCGVFACDFMQF